VAQTCNPNYLGGGDWEVLDLSSAQAKSVRPHLNQRLVQWHVLVIVTLEEAQKKEKKLELLW
jgi:hypothetical protein